MDVVGDPERPIIVRWLWDECHLLAGGRAFVVEIPAERCAGLQGERSDSHIAAYRDEVIMQVSSWPGTVTEGHVTCIVAADGRVIDPYVMPWFPYSNLWNGYCPLLRLGIRVAKLDDLDAIPSDVIQQALHDHIPSLWCLDLDSWDGTELATERG